MPPTEKHFGESNESDSRSLASITLARLESKFGEQSIQELDHSMEIIEEFSHELNPEISAAIKSMVMNIRMKLVEKIPGKPGKLIQLSDYRKPNRTAIQEKAADTSNTVQLRVVK